MLPDHVHSENYQEVKNKTVHQVEEQREINERTEQAEIKAVQAALDDLKQQSNVYPEDFVRALRAESPELYNAFVDETPFEVDALLTEVDARLAEWEGKQKPATSSNVENLRQMEDRKMREALEKTELTELRMVQKKLNNEVWGGDKYSEEFVKDLKKDKPALYNSLTAEIPSVFQMNPLIAEVNVYLKNWEDNRDKQLTADAAKPTPELSKEKAYTVLGMMDAEAPEPEISGEDAYLALGMIAPEEVASSTERVAVKIAPGEKNSANKTDFKTVIAKNENEEKFMVKLVDKADENSTQIQDLVEDPAAMPVATSSRYPEKEFRYDAAKGSYYNTEGQRLLVYNGDQIVVKKEVTPAPVAAEPTPVEAAPEPLVATEPEPVAEAAPEPAPLPEVEAEVPAENLNRKEIITHLKEQNLKIVEEFIASHPDLQLKNIIDGSVNRREFRIGRPDSGVTTSVNMQVRPLDIPKKPGDVFFSVGDAVFGKGYRSIDEALTAATQVLKNQEALIAKKKEREASRIARKEKTDDNSRLG